MFSSIVSAQAIAVGVTLLGWSFLAIVLAIVFLRRSGRTRSRDSSSVLGMALQGIGFALVFSVHCRWSTQNPIHFALAGLSVLLTATAIAFVVSAIRALGKQWSLSARVLEQHELITTGPYAIVRHPIYTGFLALLLATGMAMSSLAATAGGFSFYILGTLLRTTREERLLRGAFGTEYEQYAKRVPAFIPYRWSGA
jgi:protein-S-isoprenylcysteine O-methyltransferase Ste14